MVVPRCGVFRDRTLSLTHTTVRSHATSLLALSISLVTIACGADARSAEAVSGGAALERFEELPSPAPPGSAEPNLAVGPDGRVHLSWLEPTPDSGHALRFAVLRGRAWSAPLTVARGRNFFVNWADFPSLQVLPGGRLAAHWLERSAAQKYSYDVRVATSADGGRTWGRPVTPHRDGTASEHGFVAMWASAGGVAMAWLDGRKYAKVKVQEDPAGKEMMLVSAELSPSGALGPERRVDERTCDCCQTAVAATSRGPLLIYRDRSEGEIRDIYASRFDRSFWTPPRAVHADGWKVDFCPVNGPAVAARGNRVVVAWFTGARDTARVNIAFSDDAGDAFGAPIRVDGGSPAGRVGVLLGADGGALVSWVERAGSGENAEVRVRRVSAAGVAGPPLVVAASSAARASGFPRMVASGDTVVVAWTLPGRPSSVRVARGILAPAARR